MKTESNFNEIAFHEQAIRKLFKKPAPDEESFYTTVTLSAEDVCKVIEKYVNMFKTKSEVESVELDVTFDAFSGALVTLVPKHNLLTDNSLSSDTTSETTLLTFAGNVDSPQKLEAPEKQNFKELKFSKVVKLKADDVFSMISLHILKNIPNSEIIDITPHWDTSRWKSVMLFKKLELKKITVQVKKAT